MKSIRSKPSSGKKSFKASVNSDVWVKFNCRDDSMKLMESQRISINALKAKLEENQERQLKQLDTEHQEALELLQIRLEEHHQAELDEQAKRQDQEFLELENQLEQEKLQRKQLTDNLEEEIEMYKLKLQGANNQIEKNNAQTKVRVILGLTNFCLLRHDYVIISLLRDSLRNSENDSY